METTAEVMAELEALSTEQNRKIYRRHGVETDMFGVSYANMKVLKKKIKVNHAIACELWGTANHDARILATRIADPKQADDTLLESWAADLGNYVISDAFAEFVSQTPLVQAKMEQWTESDDEWKGAVGWNLLAYIAGKDQSLPDGYFESYVETIERDIHSRKNRVRYSMNNALISIGVRNDNLEEQAIAAAERIGTVEVDHGQTSCKTPDAPSYIRKTTARRKAKA